MAFKDTMREWREVRNLHNLERIANAAEGRTGPEMSASGKMFFAFCFTLLFHVIIYTGTVACVVSESDYPSRQDYGTAAMFYGVVLGAAMLLPILGIGYWLCSMGNAGSPFFLAYFLGISAVGWIPFLVARLCCASLRAYFGLPELPP